MRNRENPGIDRRTVWLGRLGMLAVILASQVLLRVSVISRTEAVCIDGVSYEQLARRFAAEPGETLRGEAIHPGYPAAITAMHFLITGHNDPAPSPQWILSGRLVSLIANILALVGLWLLLGWVFGNWTLASLAILLMGLGRRYSFLGASVLSDSLAICFQVWALTAAYAAWRAIRENFRLALAYALAAGVLTSAAYWVRWESLVAIMAASIFWALAWLIWIRARWKRYIGVLLVALVVTAAGVGGFGWLKGSIGEKPRHAYLEETEGESGRTELMLRRKPFVRITDSSTVFPVDWLPFHESPPVQVLYQFAGAQHPLLTFLTVMYLPAWLVARFHRQGRWSRRLPRPEPHGCLLILLTAGLVFGAVMAHFVITGAIAFRYVMLPAMLLSGFAAAVLAGLGRWMTGASAGSAARRRVGLAGWAALLAVLVAAMLFHSTRPINLHMLYFRDVASAIARISRPGDYVLSEESMIFRHPTTPGHSDRMHLSEETAPHYAPSVYLGNLLDQHPEYNIVVLRVPHDESEFSEDRRRMDRLLRERGYEVVAQPSRGIAWTELRIYRKPRAGEPRPGEAAN